MHLKINGVLAVIFSFIFLTINIGYSYASTITINIPTRTIYFVSPNMAKLYPIAVGKIVSTSPLGTYRIINKQVNPVWYPPWGGRSVPSGPYNPLGYRWMGFYSDYGIHGNNVPSSIGTLASSGCIRMYEADVEELYNMVNYGDAVNVVYQTMFTRYSPTGGKALFVYPDFYKKGVNTKWAIVKALNDNGIKISEETVQKLYKNINISDPLVFSEGYKIIDNHGLVSNDIYKSDNGTLYVNVDDAKGFIGLDDQNLKDISLLDKNSKKYININDITNITGLKFNVDEGTETIKMAGNIFTYEGKFLYSSDYADYQNREILIPIKEFCNVTGRKVEWDPSKGVLIDGKTVPYKIYYGKSFFSQRDLMNIYGLNVVVDSAGRRIYIKR
ncbi:L,D-transpeptidase family protein [Thermoanaerobacterium sp. RBIITD]|uniref:L,D-transpeptidase family protein n=1 Tax=Thermoanaerobacterium sp. RBIITD TaxID=1550240 RepID=UPI000BB77AF8|nr:L,D-transpeptidase family protein [Thermoanaerobacterium sp. RBIITD]SNX55122.1 L,D-transpeptidase catalytic domain [Thermoanaerobacterium sp. RBIITD]